MSLIQIKKISITSLHTDAIVNAANSGLMPGGGVCGAIFNAAGYDRLQDACIKIGHCATGSAVITPGFDLQAKYIVHAVGPRWSDGKHGEPEQLYSAYFKALDLAVANKCKSIGFPLISAGIFGYPVPEAWDQALTACTDFLDNHPDISLDIVFAVLDDTILDVGKKALLRNGASKYKIAERGDWKTEPMPEKRTGFILKRTFSPQQMDALRKGNIPQEMEDKWFWFMEDDTLFAHRSWTGICIYRIDFKSDNNHVVTVNQEPDQFTCTDIAEIEKMLNDLLNWWSQASYDFYHEWLSETVESMKKAGLIRDKLLMGGEEVDAVYFHLPTEPDGYLSNWYISPFDLDGKHFTSVEQYIMYRKCLVFGDMDSAEAVLKTDDPAQQQKIGKNASGYIDSVWAGMRQMVAIRGLLAKFSQNNDLKQRLLDTGDAILVECAGSDKIWACGIRLNDDRRKNSSCWNGQNILGFALMEVREILRENN